jgi:hypothetical protein
VAFERFRSQFGTLLGIVTSFYGNLPHVPSPWPPHPSRLRRRPAEALDSHTHLAITVPLKRVLFLRRIRPLFWKSVSFSSDKIDLDTFRQNWSYCYRFELELLCWINLIELRGERERKNRFAQILTFTSANCFFRAFSSCRCLIAICHGVKWVVRIRRCGTNQLTAGRSFYP